MKKVLIWVAGTFFTVMCALLGMLYYFGSTMRSDKQIAKAFNSLSYQIHREEIFNHPTRWITTGSETADWTILFFHGAPGSWMDFEDYLIDSILQQSVRMIVIDRPGYGDSDYGNAETNIIRQARIAHQIMQKERHRRQLIVGYSYGGPVAGAYAARYGTTSDHLLLLAPVVHPEAERIFWFNSWLNTSLARSLLPGFINTASDEKLSHAKALNAIRHDWSRIKTPTTHLHCTDDWIAPYYANAAWTQQNITTQLLTQKSWAGDSHFLPNSLIDTILPTMIDILK